MEAKEGRECELMPTIGQQLGVRCSDRLVIMHELRETPRLWVFERDWLHVNWTRFTMNLETLVLYNGWGDII